jgi:hypothetical protein
MDGDQRSYYVIDETEGRGVTFCDPHGENTVSRIMDGFVDDTTIWSNAFLASLKSDQTEQIAEDLKGAAQWWEELLVATGGKLELPKCFYYLICWAFNGYGDARAVDVKYPVTITDHTTNELVQIEQKPGVVPHKTLGAFLSPDPKHVKKLLYTGKKKHKDPSRLLTLDKPTRESNQANKDKTKPKLPKLGQTELHKKTMEFARGINASPMNKYEGNLMHRQVYTPSVRYGLHVLNTDKKFLKKINGPIAQALLNCMGYNKNMDEAIRHGPLELGGAGVLNLATAHSTSKINHIIQHLRMGRTTGHMIKVALEWAQVMAGTTTPILEDNKVLPHLTEQWLAGVQEFLVENNSSIHIPSLREQQVRRTNDQRIMDIVMKQQRWTPRQIRNINNCRLYLRVENISNMANNQGDRILQPILKGIRCGSTSTMHWPIQARPSSGKGAWTDWRAFLKSICRHANILRKPLG